MPEPPTLFIDEADTFFGNKDELAGIVNAGHTRKHASVLRASVGEDGRQVSSFNVFYPKAISQLGNVLSPATLSRAVIIRMAAKPDDVKLRKLLFAPWQFLEIQGALKTSIDNIRPKFYKSQIVASKALERVGLSNREADNYIPLYAIASAASPEWAARCLLAAKSLIEPAKSLSTGQEILTNIQAIMTNFVTHTDKTTGETTPIHVIGSNDLLTQLLLRDDFGWSEYNNGRPLTVRLLAQLLKPFGVTPDLHRPKGGTPKRGYSIAQLETAISQYLPSSPSSVPVPPPAPTPTPKPIPTSAPQKHKAPQQRKTTKNEETFYKCKNPAGSIPKAKILTDTDKKPNDPIFDAAAAYERQEQEYKNNKKKQEATLRERNKQPPPSPFDDFEDIPF
jgi:putative DNA primase/helicase